MGIPYSPIGAPMAVVVWYVIGIVVSIAIFIGVSILLRHFWCWYIKMNKVVSLLEEQNRLLARIAGDADAINTIHRLDTPAQSPNSGPL